MHLPAGSLRLPQLLQVQLILPSPPSFLPVGVMRSHRSQFDLWAPPSAWRGLGCSSMSLDPLAVGRSWAMGRLLPPGNHAQTRQWHVGPCSCVPAGGPCSHRAQLQAEAEAPQPFTQPFVVGQDPEM